VLWESSSESYQDDGKGNREGIARRNEITREPASQTEKQSQIESCPSYISFFENASKGFSTCAVVPRVLTLFEICVAIFVEHFQVRDVVRDCVGSVLLRAQIVH
jgi:hypothetical protein